MERVIVINEDAARGVWVSTLNEAFHPLRWHVLKVKEYLDKTFVRDAIDDVDEQGMPLKRPMVDIVRNGQILRQMDGVELLMHLDDKFMGLIKDDADRKKFLKAIVNYWYAGKISKEGLLPVNVL